MLVKKILITGAGGFLGSHLVEKAKLNFDVYGISLRSKINLPELKCSYFNIGEAQLLIDTLETIQPDYIIHCAAISGESGCRNYPEKAFNVNVSSVTAIARYCTKHKVRLLFTSSDLVFDGGNPLYDESAEVQPSMEYGKLKRAAELAFVNFENIVCLRLPLLYGIGLSERHGLLAQFRANCQQNTVQQLFDDEYRTPVFVEDIADFMLKLLKIPYGGILHLGGTESVSRYELGMLFCHHLKLDSAYLKAIKRASIGMEYRPANTSMNSELAFLFGFQPSKIGVALQKILDDKS